MEKNNLKDRWFVFCEPCGFKKILEEPNPSGFAYIKTVDIPGGAPELDPVTNKTIIKKPLKNLAKVKCPACGRGVVIRKLPDVYSQAFKQTDDREQKLKHDQEREKRIQDGQPIKREKSEPDFLG